MWIDCCDWCSDRSEPSGITYVNGSPVYDTVDAHFHHLTRDNLFAWTYGACLWKCHSADDPELAKLKALFVLLDHFIYGDDE